MLAVLLLAFAAQVPLEPVRSSAYVGAADKYAALYGEPMYWSLSLLVGPDAATGERPQVNRAIETRGVLTVMPQRDREPDVRLCEETLRHCLGLRGAVPEIRAEFFADAPFRHLHQAAVVGAFTPDQGFVYWHVSSAEPRPEAARPGGGRTLEQIVRAPGRFAGGAVTVRGSFGGSGGVSGREGGWLLRDGAFFIRVVGREPRGRGWRLDPASAGDCLWQLEVDGTVERRAEEVVVKAKTVRLVGRDPDAACARKAGQ